MKKGWLTSIATAAGLGFILNAGAVLALPQEDARKRESYDHFEKSIGTFPQSDACLAGGKHYASIGVSFLYSVTDFTRQRPKEFEELKAVMTKKHIDIKNSQDNPRTPAILMGRMKELYEEDLKPALGPKNDQFWQAMEKQAGYSLPPSMPFTDAFRQVIAEKGEKYRAILIDQSNVTGLFQKMDDEWRVRRRLVASYPDSYIFKKLVAEMGQSIKFNIGSFSALKDESEINSIVNGAFEKVMADPDRYTKGSSIFYQTISDAPFSVTNPEVLDAVRNMDRAWVHAMRENTPMIKSEFDNYFNELWAEATNNFIDEVAEPKKIQAIVDALWKAQAAGLTPADMEAPRVAANPKLQKTFDELITAVQETVEYRTGISLKPAGNDSLLYTAAKLGCPPPP